MNLYNKLRKFASVKSSLIIAFIGLLFLVGGIMGVKYLNHNDWESTSATIVNINNEYNEDEGIIPEVTVIYKDNNGEEHTALLDSYSDSMQVDDVVEIKYNKNDPSEVSATATNWIIYVAIAVGAVAIVGGSIAFIIALGKPSKDYDELHRVKENSNSNEEAYTMLETNEETKEYVYYLSGKLGYNHALATKDGDKVFEAICNKIGIFTANKYTFKNYINQHEENYDVSHTVVTTVGDEHVEFDLSYNFKVNGENCWDYLGKLGYSMDFHLDGVRPVFDVKKGGAQVATIAFTGTNDRPGAKQYPWGNIPSNTVLKVTCKNSDIDGVAFACFCIARR